MYVQIVWGIFNLKVVSVIFKGVWKLMVSDVRNVRKDMWVQSLVVNWRIVSFLRMVCVKCVMKASIIKKGIVWKVSKLLILSLELKKVSYSYELMYHSLLLIFWYCVCLIRKKYLFICAIWMNTFFNILIFVYVNK